MLMDDEVAFIHFCYLNHSGDFNSDGSPNSSDKQVINSYMQPFVFIIDEWNCVLRDKNNNDDVQKIYLDFLCNLFKGQSYVALAYHCSLYFYL